MKKIFVLLALLLVFALAFGACRRNDNGEEPVGTPPPGETPTPTPAPPTPGDNGEDPGEDEVVGLVRGPAWTAEDPIPFLDHYFPATDLGGITLRIGRAGFPNPYHDNPVYAERGQRSRELVESRFNVTLDFTNRLEGVAWSDVPGFIAASISAGDHALHMHAGFSMGYWFAVLARQGLLVDLDEVVRANFPPAWYDYAGEWRGRIYGFMRGPVYPWQVMLYNRDLIRAAGMAYTPSEMFRQGRWSFTDFHNYLRELDALLPDDVYPFGMSHNNQWMRIGVYAAGGYIVNPRTNVPGITHPGTIEALTLLQTFVAEGLYWQPGFMPPPPEGTSPLPYGHWSWANMFLPGGMSPGELFRNSLVAISSAAPGQFAEIGQYFEFGFMPPPWGSAVQWPASGDWRDLRDDPNYNAHFHSASGSILMAGGDPRLTAEVFVNFIFTAFAVQGYNSAVPFVEARYRFLEGLPHIVVPSHMEHLFTDEDRELYQWWAGNNPRFEGMDNVSVWIPAYNDAWLNTLGDPSRDFFVSMNAVLPELTWSLFDRGWIYPGDVPPDIWALAQEFGAGIPVEEDDEDDD